MKLNQKRFHELYIQGFKLLFRIKTFHLNRFFYIKKGGIVVNWYDKNGLFCYNIDKSEMYFVRYEDIEYIIIDNKKHPFNHIRKWMFNKKLLKKKDIDYFSL